MDYLQFQPRTVCCVNLEKRQETGSVSRRNRVCGLSGSQGRTIRSLETRTAPGLLGDAAAGRARDGGATRRREEELELLLLLRLRKEIARCWASVCTRRAKSQWIRKLHANRERRKRQRTSRRAASHEHPRQALLKQARSVPGT